MIIPSIGDSASYTKSVLSQAEFGWHKTKLSIETSKLTQQLDEIQMQDILANLFSRIYNIRQKGYQSQTDIEADQVKAAELWVSTESSLKEKVRSGVASYRKRVSTLATDLQPLLKKNYASKDDMSDLNSLRRIFATLKAEIGDLRNQVERETGSLPDLLKSIEKKVKTAENTLEFTSEACFKLKEDEALLIALKAKDMKSKTEGVLSFTNQRVLFESLPTKKKERQLLHDKPMGSVAKVVKGKVGFFAPEGLHIGFKTPLSPELKFSTKTGAGDADLAVQYYDVVNSGKVDEDVNLGLKFDSRRRFKELVITYFPTVSDFCHGKCKECGVDVSMPIKTFIPEGGPIVGLFNCPDCHKPFTMILDGK